MAETSKLPIIIIACQVFKDLFERYLPLSVDVNITFLDYGMHKVPRNLKAALQEKIDKITEPSLIVLGYGLCGNGLNGLQTGIHTILVPRSDDCIAILLGSYQAYRKEFDTVPGTYYLSKGWLESGSHPLQEYQELTEKYGVQQAEWLMDVQYKNYKRLVFVAHHIDDLEKFRPKALEIAAFCRRWDMLYEEVLGSDAYIQGLMDVMVDLEKAGEEFIVLPPGSALKQNMFFRS